MSQILQANIKHRINKIGLSVSELERISGLKQGSIQNILLGRSKNPGIEIISALAKELGCSIEELIYSSSKLTKQKELNKQTLKNLPWEPDLFINASIFVKDYIAKNKIKATLDKIIECVQEIYAYSIDDNSTTIDQKFGEWIVANRCVNT